MFKFKSVTKSLMWFTALLVTFSVAGCGGSVGGSQNKLTGFVSAGPLNGSSVCAYAITGGAKGAPIGSCSTTAAGSYSINLGNYAGPVLLEATGGTYTDEATSTTNVALAIPLHSMLASVTGVATSVAITPLNELAYRNASARVGGLSSANIQSAIAAVQNNFGVADIVSTMPVDVTNVASATPAQQKYTLALATISQYMSTSSTNMGLALGNIQASSGVGALLNQAMTTYVTTTNPTFSSVTLSTLAVSSVAVTPASAVVAVGGTQQFAATATYSDSSTGPVTATASWISGAGATVGLHTGLATGVTGSSMPVITASFGGKSGAAALTVSPASVTLSSIAVTPASAAVAVGGSQQFVATGTYSDSSTAPVTTTANWASASSVVATVGLNTGLATGVASSASSVTITATIGAVSGAGALTVNAAVANPIPPTLGEAGRFAILAYAGVTTTGVTAISNGDIGITPAARTGITGFTASDALGDYTQLTGSTWAGMVSRSYAPDDANSSPFPYPLAYIGHAPYANTGAMLTHASTDETTAYNFLAADPNPGAPTRVCATELGNLTLTPGVYKTAASVGITTGTLNLDAQGNPNAVWIFSIDTNLTASSNIAFVGGVGSAKNVYWRVAGTTTIGPSNNFIGNVFDQTTVSVLTGANIKGSLFSATASVTLISNTITKP